MLHELINFHVGSRMSTLPQNQYRYPDPIFPIRSWTVFFAASILQRTGAPSPRAALPRHLHDCISPLCAMTLNSDHADVFLVHTARTIFPVSSIPLSPGT